MTGRVILSIVIRRVSWTNQIYHLAAPRLGDLDWSMTWGELLKNITQLISFYFNSNYDPIWNYLVEEKKSMVKAYRYTAFVFILSNINTARVCWIQMEKESSHIRMDIKIR